MIWKFHLNKERIVTIDHRLYFKKRRSRIFQESLPALLHVCQESRELALPRYTSVFPQPGSQSWTYTGSRELTALRDILRKLGLAQQGAITDMVEVIITHMNQHPLNWASYTQFADGPQVARYPLWFDVERDIITFQTETVQQ
ncbi:hypothetical protein CJF30_00002693 [Rutstroemia sp. NJR-2017a BBW]|nr:hypothetical protein CJF30_00002693 [Rutstroemia sp. NJR-2017a BBW]